MEQPTYTVTFGGVTLRGMTKDYAENMKEEAGAEVILEGTLANHRPAYLEPTVGRIVHYQPLNSTLPLAAIIASLEDGDFVNLTVFQPDGTTKARRNVAHTSTPHEGCWNWPPRT